MFIVVRKQYQVQASRRQTTVNKQNKHLLADAAAIFCRDAEILADIRLFILASEVTDCLRTTLLFFFRWIAQRSSRSSARRRLFPTKFHPGSQKSRKRRLIKPVWQRSSCICPPRLTDNPHSAAFNSRVSSPRGLWLWLSAPCMLPALVAQITKQMRPVNFIIQRDRRSFGDDRRRRRRRV